MKQSPVHMFASECEKVKIYVNQDMPIGLFHDFLMEIKGMMVERMVIAHQEQLAQVEAMKQQPPHESEISAMADQPELPVQDHCVQEQ